MSKYTCEAASTPTAVLPLLVPYEAVLRYWLRIWFLVYSSSYSIAIFASMILRWIVSSGSLM